MSGPPVDLTQLRGRIGSLVEHQGVICRIVEVLEQEPALVLATVHEDHIQTDQFGNPKRRTPTTFTVPVLSADGASHHIAFLALRALADPNQPG